MAHRSQEFCLCPLCNLCSALGDNLGLELLSKGLKPSGHRIEWSVSTNRKRHTEVQDAQGDDRICNIDQLALIENNSGA